MKARKGERQIPLTDPSLQVILYFRLWYRQRHNLGPHDPVPRYDDLPPEVKKEFHNHYRLVHGFGPNDPVPALDNLETELRNREGSKTMTTTTILKTTPPRTQITQDDWAELTTLEEFIKPSKLKEIMDANTKAKGIQIIQEQLKPLLDTVIATNQEAKTLEMSSVPDLASFLTQSNQAIESANIIYSLTQPQPIVNPTDTRMSVPLTSKWHRNKWWSIPLIAALLAATLSGTATFFAVGHWLQTHFVVTKVK